MSLEDPSSSSPISRPENPNPENDSLNTQNDDVPIKRSSRPSRACTIRAAARIQAAQQQAANDRKQRQKKEQQRKVEEDSPEDKEQCSSGGKIVTPLVTPPEPTQLPRWNLRSMWELASVLNFLHVFRPLLNIQVEFSAEEFETALITPNYTLGDIHMPLLKAIPPITRMALTRDTWITVLCRKLRDWWHWVADGELPIVASHGLEIEAYKALEPGVRVVILKALCDIRVEQEDVRNYIERSLKHGIQLSAFRKERTGGDSQGINYWYEDDPIIGHRLYRESRKFEMKKAKLKGSNVMLNATYLWETVATNFEEFQDVSEKLLASKNRTETSLGKKIKNDMLPEIERLYKRKERLLKKQHRQALLLDNLLKMDGLAPGRSLRDRKPVTYTFDDYDRSINEAIKITKRKQPSPEPNNRREDAAGPEFSVNGKWSGPSHAYQHDDFTLSVSSPEYEETNGEDKPEPLDSRSNRRRQRPQRYSTQEFVEALSDNEAETESEDDIVGEAVYDDEYLKKRKQRRKLSSGSEADEEYQWDEENGEDEEEEEEDESFSMSEDSDEPRNFRKLHGRTRRETKLRSVGEIQSGVRRSKRAARNRINYRQYELSESETESPKANKFSPPDEGSNVSENEEYSYASEESDGSEDRQEDMKVDPPVKDSSEREEINQHKPLEKTDSPGKDDIKGVAKRRFLDLNKLAPGSGVDVDLNTITKDEDRDDF